MPPYPTYPHSDLNSFKLFHSQLAALSHTPPIPFFIISSVISAAPGSLSSIMMPICPLFPFSSTLNSTLFHSNHTPVHPPDPFRLGSPKQLTNCLPVVLGVKVIEDGLGMLFGGSVDLDLGSRGGSVRVVDVKWIVTCGPGAYTVTVLPCLGAGGLGSRLKMSTESNLFSAKKHRLKPSS